MNSIKKTILLTQALWAKHTVRLAPEPPGRRSGVVLPSSPIAEAAAEPLRLVAVGDSLVAGSGVDNQSDALTPRIAQKSVGSLELTMPMWHTLNLSQIFGRVMVSIPVLLATNKLRDWLLTR